MDNYLARAEFLGILSILSINPNDLDFNPNLRNNSFNNEFTYFELIPRDVRIFEIIPLLSVNDLDRFRRVNKYYYLLFKNKRTWRDLIRRSYNIHYTGLYPESIYRCLETNWTRIESVIEADDRIQPYLRLIENLIDQNPTVEFKSHRTKYKYKFKFTIPDPVFVGPFPRDSLIKNVWLTISESSIMCNLHSYTSVRFDLNQITLDSEGTINFSDWIRDLVTWIKDDLLGSYPDTIIDRDIKEFKERFNSISPPHSSMDTVD